MASILDKTFRPFLESVASKQAESNPISSTSVSTNTMNTQGVGSLLDREGFNEGGELMPEEPMMEEMPMMEENQDMLPDEEMENEYIDFITDEALSENEKDYLMEKLIDDPTLSEIFDKVVEVASEFSGSGTVEGPGSGVSDSIPARLSDGEFVITAKATEEIGPDNLDRLMGMAEENANNRQAMRGGGMTSQDINPALLNERELYTKDSLQKEGAMNNPVTEDMRKTNPRLYLNPRLL
jgi:hypothetical protein